MAVFQFPLEPGSIDPFGWAVERDQGDRLPHRAFPFGFAADNECDFRFGFKAEFSRVSAEEEGIGQAMVDPFSPSSEKSHKARSALELLLDCDFQVGFVFVPGKGLFWNRYVGL